MNCFSTLRLQSADTEFTSAAQLVVLFVLLLPVSLAAQVKQVARYELDTKNYGQGFIVQSRGAEGLALVGDLKKYDDGKKKWEIIFIDSALRETWRTTILVDQRMGIIGHEHYREAIQLIFNESDNSNRISIFEIVPATHCVQEHQFKPEARIRFAHFTVIASKIVFGGYLQNEPTLFLYDFTKQVAKIIPGIFQPKAELLDLRTNVNGTFNLIFKERIGADKKLVARTYDEDGLILFESSIAVDDDKSILEAMSSSLARNELAIMGTWAYRSNNMASGIFSTVIDLAKPAHINYHLLTGLDHFLDYLKPKQSAKIKAKAEKRKSVGKPVEFKANLSAIRMQETESGFLFLTEAHSSSSNYNLHVNPPYGYNPYTYYYPYSYGFNTIPNRYYPYGNSFPPNSPAVNNIVKETRVFQTSLVFFDANGTLLCDRSLPFKEIKLSSKEQVSDFVESHGVVTLACKNGKDIIAECSSPNLAEARLQQLSTMVSDTEKIQPEPQDDSGIRAWYENYFFVFGYHTVKRYKENASRDVFYINKIKGG